MPDYSLETYLQAQGFKAVCGVDEAGRGPLAGPVCAAAVILPVDCQIEGLNDSKKLTEKKREKLFPIIQEKALAYCIAYASVEEIEEYNILNATFLAMNRAIAGLQIPADHAMIDGNAVPRGAQLPCTTVVGGDAKVMSIAAASVLAKVSRDRLLLELDEQYPQYAFAQHKGYGTKLHVEKLQEFGPCPQHRLSFLKNILR